MITLTWLGPYPIDELFVPGVGNVSVAYGTTVVVDAVVAIGMMAADASWWSATVDGGNAGSTYTDVLDGGTAATTSIAVFDGGPA